jgi:outer membrane protein TolC
MWRTAAKVIGVTLGVTIGATGAFSQAEGTWVSLEEAPLQEAPPVAAPALSGYLLEAEENNPGLQAAYYTWQKALQQIPQVTSLQDPNLTFMEYLRNNMETRSEDFQLGIAQMFPYPGKLSLRGRIAAEEARALEQEFIKARLALRREVQDAFYEHYYLEQAIRIARENLELLKHLERVATARYGVARTSNQDAIKAQVELGKLENDLRTLEDFRNPVRARLNAALNRDPGSPLSPPGEINLQKLPQETATLLEIAYRANPDLKSLDARIRKERGRMELAKKERFPDFSLGLNWVNMNDRLDADPQGEGGDALMGSVQVNLPIYRKRLAAQVKEAEMGVREMSSRRAEEENRLNVDLQTAVYRLRDAERKMQLYSGALIPKAQQSLQVTETAYSAEEADFLDLVDSQRVLLDFQNSYHRSIADYAQAMAGIEFLVGRSLVGGAETPVDSMTLGEVPLAEPGTAAP